MYRVNLKPQVTLYIASNTTLAGKEDRGYEGEALGRHGEGGMANTDELKALAAKIAEAL